MKKLTLYILLITNILHAQFYKESILDTNQVLAHFNNRGSMSIHWPSGIQSLLYGYQGILIGGEVVNSQGDTLYIFSDGFIDLADGDYEPGSTNPWGWLALRGYDNPLENKVARSNDMTSWAPTWLLWPGRNGSGVLSADLETYWVMSDSSNAEFDFYPVVSDSSIRGLGLEISCRGYQWISSLFEDFIIFTYDITNVGDFPLPKLVAGFYCDPTIGGATDSFDDLCSYNFAENLIVCWDADGTGGGVQTGYFGFVTLDSPDQLGLTSAASVLFGGNNRPKNDDLMWKLMKPGTDSTCVQPTDFVLTFSSGYFSLDIGETKGYVIACVLGSDEFDLLYNVGSARQAYNLMTSIDDNTNSLRAGDYRLGNNYPNPFNSSTVIQYELDKTSRVILKVYDLLGREIRILIDQYQNPGIQKVYWDGFDRSDKPASSGIYFYKLEANGFTQSKKMILLR